MRRAIYALAIVVAACATIGAWLWWYLDAGTPLLNGTLRVNASGPPIDIERDAAGVPRVIAHDRNQTAFALGFLHGQERFFQMDLARRIAAGELAEVFGAPIVGVDRGFRVHRFRARARQIVAGLPQPDRALLGAYIRGVNAGLGALRKPPVEYLLTGTSPAPWREEDTLLVVFYMYILLQDSQADQDFNTFLLYDSLRASAADFLAPLETQWDAPLLGGPLAPAAAPTIAELDLHGARLERQSLAMNVGERFRGSNAWAMAGSVTAGGNALLANDMHLAFGVPNVFYRAALYQQGPASPPLVGVTLPGFPCLVAGSNGSIAWGFSNSGIDAVDLVEVDQRGLASDAYRTPAGAASITSVREVIHVRGGADEFIDVRTTRFGPIVRHTNDHRAFAQLWVAHFPDAVNLGLCGLERATSVAEALELAPAMGLPAQNLVVADGMGNVGWTVAGGMPERVGGSRRLPLMSSDPAAGWAGWLDPRDYPRLESPEADRIWTANARLVGSAMRTDYGFYLLGARARQIRDRLKTFSAATEADMLNVQLDDRAVLMDRWRGLLTSVLQQDAALDPNTRARLLDVLSHWDGRASASSNAYWVIRTFREHVRQLSFEPFVAAVVKRHGEFDLDSVGDQLEQPLWQLVSTRPTHLLAPWFASWPELLHTAVEHTLHDAGSASGSVRLPSWGERNRLEMRHPMSSFIPLLGMLFDMRAAPLSGDLNMPLAQISGHGPVMRLVVSPGRESQAMLSMPGGQAGNPLTPYYGAGHEQWLHGEAVPLMPGKTRYSLTLLPENACDADREKSSACPNRSDLYRKVEPDL